VGSVDVNGISYMLPDGRPVLHDVSFRVTEGSRTALVGPNGAGKTTLIGIITGALRPDEGSVSVDGQLAVMAQFIGSIRDDTTIRRLLLSVAPSTIRAAAARLEDAEDSMIEHEDEPSQLRYAQALAD
jgi:ATPase subunit of ABC transporter with duplicated ATPase domains